MKRSGFIKRKTPMKRGTCQLKRTRLKSQSTEKAKWAKLYIQKKKDGDPFVKCEVCKSIGTKGMFHPHHPLGRIGERILRFVWLCPMCHSEIHDNGKWAREQGYLMPEFDGRPRPEGHPNPFNMPL